MNIHHQNMHSKPHQKSNMLRNDKQRAHNAHRTDFCTDRVPNSAPRAKARIETGHRDKFRSHCRSKASYKTLLRCRMEATGISAGRGDSALALARFKMRHVRLSLMPKYCRELV